MLVVPHLRPPMMIRFGIVAWRLRRRRRRLLRSALKRSRARAHIASWVGCGVAGGGNVCVSVSGTERASVAAMPTADLGSSFDRFFNAAAEFFRHLSEIHWTQFGIALLFLAAMQFAR